MASEKKPQKYPTLVCFDFFLMASENKHKTFSGDFTSDIYNAMHYLKCIKKQEER